jgi:hypothetical protein
MKPWGTSARAANASSMMPAISVRVDLLDSSNRIVPLESYSAAQTLIHSTPALETDPAMTSASAASPTEGVTSLPPIIARIQTIRSIRSSQQPCLFWFCQATP